MKQYIANNELIYRHSLLVNSQCVLETEGITEINSTNICVHIFREPTSIWESIRKIPTRLVDNAKNSKPVRRINQLCMITDFVVYIGRGAADSIPERRDLNFDATGAGGGGRDKAHARARSTDEIKVTTQKNVILMIPLIRDGGRVPGWLDDPWSGKYPFT